MERVVRGVHRQLAGAATEKVKSGRGSSGLVVGRGEVIEEVTGELVGCAPPFWAMVNDVKVWLLL